jgi:hypothetical protein
MAEGRSGWIPFDYIEKIEKQKAAPAEAPAPTPSVPTSGGPAAAAAAGGQPSAPAAAGGDKGAKRGLRVCELSTPVMLTCGRAQRRARPART